MACLFCEIVAGRIPSKKAFEDDDVYAFHDIAPQAPTHILVVPKRHVTSPNELVAGDDALVGKIVRTASDLARAAGLSERGYRMNFNCGPDAGYSVFHVHLHLLGGRPFNWPPG